MAIFQPHSAHKWAGLPLTTRLWKTILGALLMLIDYFVSLSLQALLPDRDSALFQQCKAALSPRCKQQQQQQQQQQQEGVQRERLQPAGVSTLPAADSHPAAGSVAAAPAARSFPPHLEAAPCSPAAASPPPCDHPPCDHPPGYQPWVERLRREEFGRLEGRVYADYAGAAPYSEAQLRAACQQLAQELYGNPHSEAGWGEADAAAAAAAAARRLTLAVCGASEEEYECILTAGATSALKLVGEAFPWAGSANSSSAERSPGGPSAVSGSDTDATDQQQQDGPSGSGRNGRGAATTCGSRGGSRSGGGVFLYLRDNHNSVLGIRQLAVAHGAAATAAVEVVARSAGSGSSLSSSTGGSSRTGDDEPSFTLLLCGGDGGGTCAVAAATAAAGVAQPEPHQQQLEPQQHQQQQQQQQQHLLAFPLESNFSGLRYDPWLISATQEGRLTLLPPSAASSAPAGGASAGEAGGGRWALAAEQALPLPAGRWRVLVDAAKGCTTAPPDLSRFPADFVALSYYKIFGYPTGLGALLVRREALATCLRKPYFGGGTVLASAAEEPFHRLRPGAAGWEDGTLSFLALPAVATGFEFVERLGGLPVIAAHAGAVAARLASQLAALRHGNGRSMCVLYGAHGEAAQQQQQPKQQEQCHGQQEQQQQEQQQQQQQQAVNDSPRDGQRRAHQQDAPPPPQQQQWEQQQEQREVFAPAGLRQALSCSKGLQRSLILRHKAKLQKGNAAAAAAGGAADGGGGGGGGAAAVDGGPLAGRGGEHPHHDAAALFSADDAGLSRWLPAVRAANGGVGSGRHEGPCDGSPTSSARCSEATAFFSPLPTGAATAPTFASVAATTPAFSASPSRQHSLQEGRSSVPSTALPSTPLLADAVAGTTHPGPTTGSGGSSGGCGGGTLGEEWAQRGVVGQGPVVSFNVYRADGSPAGYREVERLASLHGIRLRTGCLCNPGACAAALGLTPADIRAHYEAGHVCWDGQDVMGGVPTGVVRASFGYASSLADADAILALIRRYFVEEEEEEEEEGEEGEEGAGLVAAAAAQAPPAEGGLEAAAPSSEAAPIGPAAAAAVAGGPPLAAAVAQPAVAVAAPLPPPPGGGASSRPQAPSSPAAVVEALYIYPIKSCRGFRAEAWPLGPSGLLYDRHWLLVDPEGSPLRLKACPALARLCPSLDLARGVMVVAAEGAGVEEVLEVALPPLLPGGQPDEGRGSALSSMHGSRAAPLGVRVCASMACGERVGEAASGGKGAVSAWFQRVLGIPCRLVQQSAAGAAAAASLDNGRGSSSSGGGTELLNGRRQQLAEPSGGAPAGQPPPSPQVQHEQRSFANDGQLLLVNSASALDLQRRVAAAEAAATAAPAAVGGSAAGGAGGKRLATYGQAGRLALSPGTEPANSFLLRFRPNLMVGGDLAPYAEDTWRLLRVGGAVLASGGGCPRCDMVCADAATGQRSGPQPLLALAGYRRSRGQIKFGVLLNQQQQGQGQRPQGQQQRQQGLGDGHATDDLPMSTDEPPIAAEAAASEGSQADSCKLEVPAWARGLRLPMLAVGMPVFVEEG